MPSKTKLKNAEIAAKSAALPKIPQELPGLFIAGRIPLRAQLLCPAFAALTFMSGVHSPLIMKDTVGVHLPEG